MKHHIKIEKTEEGVTIWVNGRWVLDASLFKQDLEISMCNERMKEKKAKFGTHRLFRFDRRKK